METNLFNLLSFILQSVTILIILVSVCFVSNQVVFMRKTIEAQSYGEARRILQDEIVRKARGTVFKILKENKNIDLWTIAEIKDVGIVCHTYDSVGQMIRFEYLDKNIILKSWGHSIRRSWPVVKDLVYKYRKEWESDGVWDDFEWLYIEAMKLENKK